MFIGIWFSSDRMGQLRHTYIQIRPVDTMALALLLRLLLGDMERYRFEYAKVIKTESESTEFTTFWLTPNNWFRLATTEREGAHSWASSENSIYPRKLLIYCWLQTKPIPKWFQFVVGLPSICDDEDDDLSDDENRESCLRERSHQSNWLSTFVRQLIHTWTGKLPG